MSGYSHQQLDGFRLALARRVIERFTIEQVREKILANTERWISQGVWVSAFDEWRVIAADDAALREIMLGTDENAVRLRQSAPFVGLLSRDEVREVRVNILGA
jgi:hypothetical protein